MVVFAHFLVLWKGEKGERKRKRKRERKEREGKRINKTKEILVVLITIHN